MEVMNCKGCKRLFNYMGGLQLCGACKDELERKFQEVKEYINNHPHSSIAAVAEETEVTTKQIKQWIREERLAFSEDSMQGIECEQCGTMIRSGRYCDACKAKLQSELRSAAYIPMMHEKKATRDKDRMRFL